MKTGRDGAASVEIEVMEPCPLWRGALPDAPGLARAAARAALAVSGVALAPAAELAIVLADDAAVRALNRQWRGRDEATNVLAFASEEAASRPLPQLLGDVVVSFETARQEAAAQGKSLADHLRHLVVHGVLHLLGFDHLADAEAERMEALERGVLGGLGIADPYAQREGAHG
ncbi:MAG TPA: rRNA maturation RNase YbeY [Stellaceae bacterium]|nr:rRNA maturation RNase YbeY [Stellaceae bacterium]